MNSSIILTIIVGYFLILLLVSFITVRNNNNDTFFRGNRKSPWYIVAFGMIGASLSGVTFLSIPGVVGSKGVNESMAYMQIVLGYLFGYIIIANLLLPLYYKLKLTSIYTYLEERFGEISHKTGGVIFIISKIMGAALRLYLVVIVLQKFMMDSLGVPFYATASITIALIWLYTFRGGIKTIIWTDTLQTMCMLIALFVSIIILSREIGITNISDFTQTIIHSNYSKIFHFDNGWSNPNFFFKQFLSGIFITIVMTGLDQDMMQKNLTCRNLKDAKKNMYSLGGLLIPVNLLFLTLGVLLFLYAQQAGIDIPTENINGRVVTRYDLVYPTIALNYMPIAVGVVFLIGIIAAAYSSADSALTSLTTSFSMDFLKKEVIKSPGFKKTRNLIHLGFSILLLATILIFWIINDSSVINLLFVVAGYTYGPLLGLFSFGLFTKHNIHDKAVPFLSIISPIVSFLLSKYSTQILGGYKMGFELLIINGLIMFLLLYLFRKKKRVTLD